MRAARDAWKVFQTELSGSSNVWASPGKLPIEVKMQRSKQSTNSTVKDGDYCKVIGGTHAGKSGTVRDLQMSKTGAMTITVVQSNGERFKTLAKNVVIKQE